MRAQSGARSLHSRAGLRCKGVTARGEGAGSLHSRAGLRCKGVTARGEGAGTLHSRAGLRCKGGPLCEQREEKRVITVSVRRA
jgi:hypothetical protein